MDIPDPLGLELCTKGKEWVDLHSSICQPHVEPASFVESVVLFPPYGFSSFVKDQVTIGVRIYSGSSIPFH